MDGADLARRMQRAMLSQPHSRRYRELEKAGRFSKAKDLLFRKAENARRTQARAYDFAGAMAGARGLRFRSATSTAEGQSQLAANYSRRPRYSTRQRIRPTWSSVGRA